MAQGKWDRLSTEQRIDMWRRWKAGESLHEIGRAFGKGHGSIRFLLTQRGGIVPAARRRSPRTLTLAEREDISRGIASGSSIREIASGLQRAVSTGSREVSRHGGRRLYRASEADRRAWESALRPVETTGVIGNSRLASSSFLRCQSTTSLVFLVSCHEPILCDAFGFHFCFYSRSVCASPFVRRARWFQLSQRRPGALP